MSGYTPHQINQFYDRINLSSDHRHSPSPTTDAITASHDSGLEFLTVLQRCCLTSIPFENLDLHYSTHHSISVTADAVFGKIVSGKDGKGGRGGYCMENNTLFLNVLLGLGFRVYSTGARISSSVSGAPKPLDEVTFSGWSHMVNLVSFPDSSTTYMVDIGFGGGGATKPIPLLHDLDGFLNIAPALLGRLVSAPIPGAISQQQQKFWIYEKKGKEGGWSPCYCFSETEFLESDFGVMNYWTSTSPESWFTKIPVCLRMVFDGEGKEIVGSVQIFKEGYKERKGDEEVTREVKSEKERLDILEKEFGIVFDEQERKGIEGMVSELK